VVSRLIQYNEALDYLFARTTGVTKLGLERTEALLGALGNPHDALSCFHIAGTNGKGSVAAILERLLQRMGFRVGKYTSPHLVDFTERIVVDGRPIDKKAIEAFVDRWMPLVETTGATFFEATTAFAFDVFARAEVDVAVVETGLGGRMDSTNVITPRVAIVTGVGMDHSEFLGTSIAEIAVEKAGIFKRGVPAVVGERSPDIRARLAGLAGLAGASRVCVVAEESYASGIELHETTSFRLRVGTEEYPVVLGMRGVHQAWNAMTAIFALRCAGGAFHPPPHLFTSALADLSLPGRCQVAGNLILDVAHNPEGAAVLAGCLKALYPQQKFTVLLCVLADKDWRGMVHALAEVASRFILTDAPGVPELRRWNLVEVGEALTIAQMPHAIIADLDVALRLVTSQGEKVLVTGSFHTVGEAMTRLQLSPLPG
jgi:dihydrofolate synthase/folylpolyglutamate synthase